MIKKKEDTLVIIELKQDGNSGLCFIAGLDCYLASSRDQLESAVFAVSPKDIGSVVSICTSVLIKFFLAVIRIFPIPNDKRMKKKFKVIDATCIKSSKCLKRIKQLN